MALDKARAKTNIVNRIETEYGIVFTPAQRVQAEKIWNIVCDEIFKEIATYGEIQLLAGDIMVPATGLNAPDGGGAVTGQAQISAVNLTGRLE